MNPNLVDLTPEQFSQLNTAISGLNKQVQTTNQTKGTNLSTVDPLKIVSSSDAINNKNKQDAIINAGNNLTGGRPQPPSQPDLSEGLESSKDDAIRAAQEQAKRTQKAIQLNYDASLASKNFKYQQMQEDLQRNFDRQSQAAQATAQALNPYSTSRGASTAQNFQNRITSDYQTASAKLQQQADLAQQQLEAGNYAAYVQLQNGLEETVSSINSNFQNSLLDLVKQQEQTRQFEANLFSQEQRAAADDFRLGLSQINYTPESIEKMIADGTIYQDPTFLSGVKANGVESIPGIISAMKQGSLAQQKQMDLQFYREQQLALSNARLANAQENMTRMQSIQMAQQNALAGAQGSGYNPNDIKYAVAAAQGSTLGSQPTQADRDYYRDVQSLTANAERFRVELDKLANNSQARNAISTWINNPLNDEAQTFLATQMPATYRIASIAFGQSGRGLSDRDFQVVQQAIGSGPQSAKAREDIFRGWLQDAQVGMSSKLKADAFGGINVAPYAYDVEYAAENINKLIDTTKGKQTTTFGSSAKSILDQYGVKY